MLIWLNLVIAFIVFYGGSIVYKELSEPIVPAYAQYKQLTEKIEPMPKEVLDTINYVTRLYGVEPSLMIKIAQCESGMNPNIIGNEPKVNLNSIGLLQFQPASWAEYAGKYKMRNANIYDYRDQIILASQLLRDGKCHIWSCCPK